MPVFAPSQSKGLRFQIVRTTALPKDRFQVGDIAAFVRSGKTPETDYYEIARPTSPGLLSKMLCVVMEEALAGQECNVLVSGFVPKALLTFRGHLDDDTELVATMAGSLSPHGEKGARIVGYTRGALPEQNKDGRTLGAVFFDGVTGFGPMQWTR